MKVCREIKTYSFMKFHSNSSWYCFHGLATAQIEFLCSNTLLMPLTAFVELSISFIYFLSLITNWFYYTSPGISKQTLNVSVRTIWQYWYRIDAFHWVVQKSLGEQFLFFGEKEKQNFSERVLAKIDFYIVWYTMYYDAPHSKICMWKALRYNSPRVNSCAKPAKVNINVIRLISLQSINGLKIYENLSRYPSSWESISTRNVCGDNRSLFRYQINWKLYLSE